jgi:hypothetical protein
MNCLSKLASAECPRQCGKSIRPTAVKFNSDVRSALKKDSGPDADISDLQISGEYVEIQLHPSGGISKCSLYYIVSFSGIKIVWSQKMNSFGKIGGISAILEAVIYVSAFIFYGAIFDFPVGVDSTQEFTFLANNQVILSVVNFIMYVLFGVFLAVLVLALHERLKGKTPALSQLAVVFGVVWVGLVIASGMIANIGLSVAIKLSAENPDQAMTVWLTISSIVEGLGGGNEFVGGLWVLLLSTAALKGNELSKKLNYFGLLVGSAGILTVYPADVLTEIFGLSQIVWFVWLGSHMLRS